MRTLEYTYWQDGKLFIGHVNEYPEYETQAYSKDELLANLKNLLTDIESNEVPYLRKVEAMVLA